MAINLETINGVVQALKWDDRTPVITKENFYNWGQTLDKDKINEFLGQIAKISEQYVYSMTFSPEENPFSVFFKAPLETGEFIERTYVGIINGETPTFDDNGQKSLSRKKPPVLSKYNSLNFSKEYGITISDTQAKSAFLSLANMNQELSMITSVLPNSVNLDLFNASKELFSKAYVNDVFYNDGCEYPTDKTTAENLIEKIKNYFFAFKYPSTLYNASGVISKSFSDNYYLIMNYKILNALTVKALSAAFNMSEIDFRKKLLVVDDSNPFGSICDGTLCSIVDGDFFNIHKQDAKTNSILVPVGGGYYNIFMYINYAFGYYTCKNGVRIYDNTKRYRITQDAGVTASKTDDISEGEEITLTGAEKYYISFIDGNGDVMYCKELTGNKFKMYANNITVSDTEKAVTSSTYIE